MREEWNEKVKQEELKKAQEEAKRELGDEAELEKEEKDEATYQENLLTMKARLGLIT